ncbi:MAG: hypothetical protein LBB68_00595, partial [Treponema sp.]|nr:hypothetical protein [Treponema sp.]
KDEFLIIFCVYKCKTTTSLTGVLNFYARKFENSYLLDSPKKKIKRPKSFHVFCKSLTPPFFAPQLPAVKKPFRKAGTKNLASPSSFLGM